MALNRTGRWAAVAALAIGVHAPASLGQHPGDGRALDRNPQQGSGGRNTPTRDLKAEMQFQNSIITGNAGGGKSFHGDVGYLSADEVRATLGSNDLYSFHRDSSASTLPSLGIRGTDALRYQYTLATGTAPPPGLAGSMSLSRSQAGATGGQIGGLRSTADYLTQRESRQTVIAYRPQIDGSAIALTASPLLGVREISLAASQLGEPGKTQAGAPSPGSETVTPKPTWAFTGTEALPRGVVRPLTRAGEMDTSAPTDRTDATQTRTNDAVVTRFREELAKTTAKKAGTGVKPAPTPAGEAGNKPADEEDWRTRLEELRGTLRPKKTPTKPAAKPGEGTDTKPAAPAGAEAGNDEALAQARIDAARRAAQQRFLQGLNADTIDALKRTKPTVNELAGHANQNDNLAYSEHMALGQLALAEGRYFDAEDKFTRALAAINGDPMAQVGRVHAEVGSGLYMSGAVNVRNLIVDHPELVGTRYGAKLLPAPDRWAAIATQLRARLSGDDPPAAEAAGLLLAYMGYQFADGAAVKDGLAELARHVEGDEAAQKLLELVRTVWLEPGEKTDPAK